MVLLDLAERFPDRLRHLVRLTRTVSRFGNFTNRTRLIIRHKLERNLSEVTLGPNSTKCSGFAPLLLGSTQTHRNRFRNRLHHVLRVSIKRALSDDSTGSSRSSSSRLHVPLLKSFRVRLTHFKPYRLSAGKSHSYSTLFQAFLPANPLQTDPLSAFDAVTTACAAKAPTNFPSQKASKSDILGFNAG
jgi:hypothetical protein